MGEWRRECGPGLPHRPAPQFPKRCGRKRLLGGAEGWGGLAALRRHQRTLPRSSEWGCWHPWGLLGAMGAHLLQVTPAASSKLCWGPASSSSSPTSFSRYACTRCLPWTSCWGPAVSTPPPGATCPLSPHAGGIWVQDPTYHILWGCCGVGATLTPPRFPAGSSWEVLARHIGVTRYGSHNIGCGRWWWRPPPNPTFSPPPPRLDLGDLPNSVRLVAPDVGILLVSSLCLCLCHRLVPKGSAAARRPESQQPPEQVR